MFLFLGYKEISESEFEDPRGIITSKNKEIFDLNGTNPDGKCTAIWYHWETKMVTVKCDDPTIRKHPFCLFNLF